MADTSVRLQVIEIPEGLTLVGEIDAHTAPMLAERLEPLPGVDGPVVLDVEGIEFIDSSGLRVIVEAHQRADGDGRSLVIRKPSAAVKRLLEISGLADHLTVSD